MTRVCGLGYIIWLFLYTSRDKNHLLQNWIIREYRGLYYIPPHTLNLQCIYTCCELFTILFRWNNQTSIYFPWRCKMHNFDIKQWGWNDIPLTEKFCIRYFRRRVRNHSLTAYITSGLSLTENGILFQ